MSELSQASCEACRIDAPTVGDAQAQHLLTELPEWSLITVDGIKQLQREYRFKNFAAAMEMANRVAQIAEEEGHHPSILVEWGKMTVTWWSHSIKGLHRNDFIMAAKTDDLQSKAAS